MIMDDVMEDTKSPLLPLRFNRPGKIIMLTVLAMLAMGVVMVHSALASVAQPGAWYQRVIVRHSIFAVGAFVILMLVWRFNYQWLAKGKGLPWLSFALLLLSLGLAALVYVPGIGHSVGGRYRWIRIGPPQFSIGFQPSELIRLAVVVFLACWLYRRGEKARGVVSFLFCLFVLGVAELMVAPQDFGMGILIALSVGMVMLLAGIRWIYLLLCAVLGGGGIVAAILFLPGKMARFTAMLNPWDDTTASTYQARQAILSVLSGDFAGRGLGNGVRKLGYLPEDSTDFLFASFAEEWGLRGGILIGCLWLCWLICFRMIATQARDGLGRVLAAGLGAMLALQAILHLAVNLVLLPPTGIGLPFMSAGGTSLILTSLAAGLIVSVSARPADEFLPGYEFTPGQLASA